MELSYNSKPARNRNKTRFALAARRDASCGPKIWASILKLLDRKCRNCQQCSRKEERGTARNTSGDIERDNPARPWQIARDILAARQETHRPRTDYAQPERKTATKMIPFAFSCLEINRSVPIHIHIHIYAHTYTRAFLSLRSFVCFCSTLGESL